MLLQHELAKLYVLKSKELSFQGELLEIYQ